MRALKILHVLRAPVGGLFRHVVDLAGAQAERGHRVGIVADSTTGSDRAEAILSGLAPALALGIVRVPMSRHIGFDDIHASRRVRAMAARGVADVVHGHGAKGGAYARLVPREDAIRVYTPHGGSLHYSRSSPLGFLYLGLERLLMSRTEVLIFESAYAQNAFRARVGLPTCQMHVIHNGLVASEFEPVDADSDRSDLVFVGELRFLKGVDLLIDALALLRAEGSRVSASIVGAGPDAARFQALAAERTVADQVRFLGPLPARTAFAKGRILVAPSRAESLPYVVLEAAAAGRPIIATAVGGIPEIFAEDATHLVPPDDARALASTIRTYIADPLLVQDLSKRLQDRARQSFSAGTMSDQVLAAYEQALARG